MAPITVKALTLAALLAVASAAPKAAVRPAMRRRQQEGMGGQVGGNDGNVVSADPVGPPGASGNFRGSPSLGGYSPSNPIPMPDTAVPADEYTLDPAQKADEDLGFYLDFSKIDNPQPVRGAGINGGNTPTDPGPRNRPLDKENEALFAPPGTDSGDVPNAKWPMGLSHNRHGLKGSGWARQQNVNVLPAATALAGVNMRLEANSYRELHWHKASEWAYILNGTVRINAVNEAGQTFTDDLGPGDVWFFPAGIPHSIQAFEGGTEFLLVFDDGAFSEDETFLLSELAARNPKPVLAKDLRLDISALDNIPDDQLWIFEGSPTPKNIQDQNVTGPAGALPLSQTYSYHFSQQQPYTVPGGSLKILDTKTFPTAKNFAACLFTIKPGAMRELHWHVPNGEQGDEWSFFIQGQARLTVFSAPQSSRSFDFQAGDVGYVPVPNAHYLENTGDTDLVYLEILNTPVFSDISVAQWLGLTPKQIVSDHLGLSEDTLNRLPKIKPFILPGSTNKTETNFEAEQE